MEGGRIVEQGSHAELLAAGDAYDALYHAQFAAAVAPDEPREGLTTAALRSSSPEIQDAAFGCTS